MKRFMMIAAAVAAAFVLASCSKDPARELLGSYTYKTSGTVTLVAVDCADTLVASLSPEQGQLHIVRDGAGDGKVVVTFDDLLGNADIADGIVNGKQISLTGKTRKSIVLTDGILTFGSGQVDYSGAGRRYDDMLVLDLSYSGAFRMDGIDMVVIDSDVHCVARCN